MPAVPTYQPPAGEPLDHATPLEDLSDLAEVLCIPLGSYVRDAREAAGLTQARLAGLLDVEPSVVSRWESDAVRPSGESLQQIVAALRSVRP